MTTSRPAALPVSSWLRDGDQPPPALPAVVYKVENVAGAARETIKLEGEDAIGLAPYSGEIYSAAMVEADYRAQLQAATDPAEIARLSALLEDARARRQEAEAADQKTTTSPRASTARRG